MERINKLLDNYFKGATTLAEEAELKQYFATGTIDPEHTPYSALFEAFGQELQQQYSAPVIKVQPKPAVKRMWVRTLIYSGIAASLVLAVWIQRPRQEEDYAIIRGQRIDNPEYAQRYAEKKLKDVNEMLRYKLKPLRDAQALKDNLRNVGEGGSDKSQIIE